MKCLACSILSVVLFSASLPGFAQPPVAKPVLSADPAPSSAPVPGAPTALPGTVDPSYVIGADDSIRIDVWKEPSYSGPVLVRPDGMITVPGVGDILAAGRTPIQLRDEVIVQLKKLVIDPTVTVSVLAVNSKRIYLTGEIAHVGPIGITPGMTILQAISTAGGLTPFAKRHKIYILRGDPAKPQKIFFDYDKALKSGNMQGITLVPGDTIVVP
jgi:polysaccharide biosynthesis/export protein